ncbi:MAG: NAD-dependent epimerase/dehydratase family protein [Verrucomicrobiaceae bacterium]
MKIFLTGATGFIGRHVLPALQRRGHEVVTTRIDLLNPSEVRDFLESGRFEGLVHLAWEATPGKYWTSPENPKWTEASLEMLENFGRCGGRRVVMGGTSAEYAWGGEGDLSESSVLEPDSLYGRSKNLLRESAEQMAEELGVSMAWGRVFCPFGPFEDERRLIPRLVKKLEGEGEIPFDSGRLERDFLAVEELGDAFGALFDSPVGGAVNLASGEGVTIREVFQLLARSRGQEGRLVFDVLPDPEGQVPRVVAAVDRLRDEVGWCPGRSLAESLSSTAHWWTQQSQNESQ